MSVIDPRELGDRAMFAHILFGALPRRGWPGRRRAIARRVLELLCIAIAVLGILALGRLVIIVAWAASL